MGIHPEAMRFLREWVKRRSGILLEGKEVMIESRLTTLCSQVGLVGVEALLEALKTKPDSELATRVLETLTTNETFWFRDHYPFEVFRTAVVPEILEERKAVKRFKLWSAACSMGQEPYSIAMLLKMHFPQLDKWQVTLLATDLAKHVVDKAALGKYDHLEVNRGLPAQYLARFFQDAGDQWQIKPEIRNRIEFRTLNLTEAFVLPADLDVVFIRNVLIYFDVPTKRAILLRALGSLRPGGYLFLGAAESIYGLDLPLLTVNAGKTVYYRKAK
jgi:chemotaxis protein methyltransferase CheR